MLSQYIFRSEISLEEIEQRNIVEYLAQPIWLTVFVPIILWPFTLILCHLYYLWRTLCLCIFVILRIFWLILRILRILTALISAILSLIFSRILGIRRARSWRGC